MSTEAAGFGAIGAFVAGLDGTQRMEILPFRHMGRAKWEATGEPYLLGATEPPSAELVARLEAQSEGNGLPVSVG